MTAQDRTQWRQADILDLDSWVQEGWASEPGILYSVHFHEFLAAGTERMTQWLRQLAERLPGWIVVALEQHRLEEQSDQMPESLWLYNQSNLLIHHLIGNGRILILGDGKSLFESGHCKIREIKPMKYLGYHAFIGFL